jgi:hypothetical protein
MRNHSSRSLVVWFAIGTFLSPVATAFWTPPLVDRTRVRIVRRVETQPHTTNNDETTTSTTSTKNRVYVEGLLETLQALLDKWIMNGSPVAQERAYNVLDQIQRLAQDPDLAQRAQRLVQRAGLPAKSRAVQLSNGEDRRGEAAEQRHRWEDFRRRQAETSEELTAVSSIEATGASYRSALSQRAANKPDLFLGHVEPRLELAVIDKVELQKELTEAPNSNQGTRSESSPDDRRAASKVSEYVAKAGAHFAPDALGIGGLDDVLAQVKRRVWTPLAAPPMLLRELGIHPVRGLLLYGKPGCGKTLLARTLGKILSPLRYVLNIGVVEDLRVGPKHPS